MRSFRLGMALLLVTLVSGCSTVSVTKKPLETMPVAKEEKGLVYFFREKKFVGSAVDFHVADGENVIGALESGTFFFYEAEPGVHNFWAATESKSDVTLDVQAGQTYFIQGGIDMGVWVGSPSLAIVHELQGKSKIPSLQYAVVDEKRLTELSEKLKKKKQQEAQKQQAKEKRKR